MSEQHKIPDWATDIDHVQWYEENIDTYKTLAESVVSVLKTALRSQKISYVDIPFRYKEKKSFLKKLKGKSYANYTEMTDLAGIRVITLVERDVEEVGNLINQLFQVHVDDSVNKSASLGDNKVGYRSVHHVCDIGKTRSGLLENIPLEGLSFEIQVRTALEHAWAEIEHDRGYKLDGELPSHLKRRFALLSGLLESADLEFNRLTLEIEEYSKEIAQKVENNDLKFELTTVGLEQFFAVKYPDIHFKKISEHLQIAIRNLQDFGINSIEELDVIAKVEMPFIIDNNIMDYLSVEKMHYLLTIIMVLSNPDRFFKVWSESKVPAISFPSGVKDVLYMRHNQDEINDLIDKYNIKFYFYNSK